VVLLGALEDGLALLLVGLRCLSQLRCSYLLAQVWGVCCGFSVPRASSGGRRPWTRWPSEKPSASSESSRGRQCRCGWGR
jgi:hypothetical protein